MAELLGQRSRTGDAWDVRGDLKVKKNPKKSRHFVFWLGMRFVY